MNRIRELREEMGKTQKELGKIIGVAEGTISQYESGSRKPSHDKMDKLATYFDCSIDYLMGRIEIRENLRDIYVEITEDAIENGISPEQLKSIIKVYKEGMEEMKKQNKK